MTSDIAIGRRTGKNALYAYGVIKPSWGFLGKLTFLVPAIIMTYYSVICGWATKYIAVYATRTGASAVLSVSMGIMITYGFYVKKDVDLNKSIMQIEVCDTIVALLAGMLVTPAIYVFSGIEGMASGPSLMFVSLPKVFLAMGAAGTIVGIVFFIMVTFATLTSCVSILECLVANCMELFHMSRKKLTMIIGSISAAASILICLGYNALYFKLPLPNGSVGQLLNAIYLFLKLYLYRLDNKTRLDCRRNRIKRSRI